PGTVPPAAGTAQAPTPPPTNTVSTGIVDQPVVSVPASNEVTAPATPPEPTEGQPIPVGERRDSSQQTQQLDPPSTHAQAPVVERSNTPTTPTQSGTQVLGAWAPAAGQQSNDDSTIVSDIRAKLFDDSVLKTRDIHVASQ